MNESTGTSGQSWKKKMHKMKVKIMQTAKYSNVSISSSEGHEV
jgi:hypothetical protein